MFYGFLPQLDRLAKLCVMALCLGCAGVTATEKPVNASDKTITDLVTTGDKGSELQLEVRQMPLTQVLESIAQKTRVPIHYSVLPEGLVTATCVGTNLKQVLECLLSRETGVIARYSRSSANIYEVAEVWILGSTLNSYPAASAGCATTAGEAKVWLKKVRNVDAEPDLTDELLKMSASKNPEERANAIGALLAEGREDDPAVKAALEAALSDQDANVRAQAISSLAHREGSDAAAAIQAALHDDSADVRMMAVDGITDDIALLQQAMNDSDETVRSLAAIKLEDITQ